MSDFADMSMAELFRFEVDTQTALLDEGLLSVERDPTDRARLEALMRAAHSVKGAARIVGMDAGVSLAHAMEEAFVAAMAGTTRIDRGVVDAELVCVDLLRKLARCEEADVPAWTAQNADAIASAVGKLEAAVRAATEAMSRAPAVAEEPEPAQDEKEPERGPVRDRVVRVAAESMSRVLALTSETLVEAGRLEGLVDTLRVTRARQAGLAEVLDELRTLLPERGEAHAALEEARQRTAELMQGFGERIEEAEDRARSTHDLATRLYREVLGSRMRPFEEGVRGLSRVVRDVARELDKDVSLVVTGGATGVDRDILEKLEAPLGHIVRNALDHGIEPPAERRAAGKTERAQLRIEASHRAGLLHIVIKDDGRGIDVARIRARIVERGLANAARAESLSDAEVLEFIFLPGFSTKDAVTHVSGRGVGLDVVQSTLREVGGDVHVTSSVQVGTTFTLKLPLTRSVSRCLLFDVGGSPHALPLHRIERVLSVSRADIATVEGREFVDVDGRAVGVLSLAQVLELAEPKATEDLLRVVVIADRATRFGLVVDRLLGEQELVVRPLDPRLHRVQDVAALAIGRDGSPVVVLDAEDLARSCAALAERANPSRVATTNGEKARRKRVLVVEDSITVREVERQLLVNKGYDVAVAVDGVEGWNTVRASDFALVITDVDMPRMTGLELTRAIKQHPRLRSVPVMIVSYKERDEDRLRGLDAGADYYLGKTTFHDDALLRAVEDLIGGPT